MSYFTRDFLFWMMLLKALKHFVSHHHHHQDFSFSIQQWIKMAAVQECPAMQCIECEKRHHFTSSYVVSQVISPYFTVIFFFGSLTHLSILTRNLTWNATRWRHKNCNLGELEQIIIPLTHFPCPAILFSVRILLHWVWSRPAGNFSESFICYVNSPPCAPCKIF